MLWARLGAGWRGKQQQDGGILLEGLIWKRQAVVMGSGMSGGKEEVGKDITGIHRCTWKVVHIRVSMSEHAHKHNAIEMDNSHLSPVSVSLLSPLSPNVFSSHFPVSISAGFQWDKSRVQIWKLKHNTVNIKAGRVDRTEYDTFTWLLLSICPKVSGIEIALV